MSITTPAGTRRYIPRAAQAGWLALLLLALLGLAAPLLTAPSTGELLLPGSNLHWLNLLGLRLSVLAAWLAQLLILRQLGRNHLPQRWLNLFLAFFWLTGSRYLDFQPHAWSGLTAMASVLAAWKYLQTLYNGKVQPRWISLSGCLCAASLWLAPTLGVCLSLSMLAYSLFHCFLHEREEKGLAYRKVDKRAVMSRWSKSWGAYGVLPWLAFQVVCISLLVGFSVWPEFLQTHVHGLMSGQFLPPGYDAAFHLDFMNALQPLTQGVASRARLPQRLLAVFSIPSALQLFIIGALPVTGILATWYQLPDRLHYRLLQRQDDELLLFLLSAMAMIGATMLSDSTALHIVSNGGVAFLLGFIVIHRALIHKSTAEKRVFASIAFYCGITLLAAVAASLSLLLR